LQKYLDHVDVVSPPTGVPVVRPLETLSFQAFVAEFPPQDDTFEASLWRLASALFDPIPSDVSSEVDDRKAVWISDLRRKMKIGDWLQSAVAHSVENVMLDGSTTPIAQVFSLLSGNQVQRAAEVAMDAGDFHLATLISQIGGDKRFRETMFQQWRTWVKEGADVFMDEDYKKVYALLAGEATRGVGSKSKDPFLKVQDVDITKGMDWKRVFALVFWYSCRVEDPASTAVEYYNETTAKELDGSGQAVKLFNPAPWYIQGITEDWGNEGDGLLHLLRLFQNPEYSLADTLSPRSYNPQKLDYRVPWQLYAVLSTLKLQDPAESKELRMLGDKLTVAYSMQLENEESIDSAAFVLLHLNDDTW
jgi:nuclear pore complex protein Nup98-Nup96